MSGLAKLGHGFVILWLIGANLIPIFGVLNWGWDVSEIMFLFAAETAVIALFCIARMMTARLPSQHDGEGLAWRISEFAGILGFGTAAGIGVFFFILLFELEPLIKTFSWESGLGLAVTGLLSAHFIVFLTQFILNGKFLRTASDGNFFPLAMGRILFTASFAVVVGQFVTKTGYVIVGLICLCLAKMLWEVGGYIYRNFEDDFNHPNAPDEWPEEKMTEEELRAIRGSDKEIHNAIIESARKNYDSL